MKTKLSAIILMIIVTFLTSSAQAMYKIGAQNLSFNIFNIITNYYVIGGLFLYGLGAIIMIMALKGGDLSVLYPIISTSYIWVALLSFIFFDETVNTFRWFGIATIVIGIILISTAKTKEAVQYTEPM